MASLASASAEVEAKADQYNCLQYFKKNYGWRQAITSIEVMAFLASASAEFEAMADQYNCLQYFK